MTSSTAMYAAVARGDAAAVRAVVTADRSVLETSFLGANWLHWAAMSGRVELLEVLTNEGMRIDQLTDDGFRTPLVTAAGQGHVKACEWLLDHGADINHGIGKSATPVFSAIFSKSLELVELFVARGADLGATFGEPSRDVLGYAKVYGTPQIVAFLRNPGGDPSSPPV